MIPTEEYITKKFDEFNAMCFGGELKPLPIRLVKARTFLGQIAYKRRRRFLGGWRYSDFVFKISIKHDLPEDVVEDTILHEMIHYYILSNQMHDTSAHGQLFRKKMQEINERYGRHITISHRKTDTEREADTERRNHLVCLTAFSDGTLGVTIATRAHLFKLWDTLPQLPRVTECRWFLSHDPFFNRFPRARSLKVYRITRADADAHLSDAKPLVRDGSRIFVGRRQ